MTAPTVPTPTGSARPARPALVRFPAAAGARVQLVCFAHAGAGAAPFAGWPGLLPEWTAVSAVRLPGRESRLREQPLGSLDAVADAAAREIAALPGPVVLFGHCFGAVAAYRTAQLLETGGRSEVRRLIVAAAPAPDATVGGTTHLLDGPGLFADLIRYGAVQDTPAARSLFALAEPAIRADFQALETWTVPEPAARPLAAPVLELRGADDRVLDPDGPGWSGWTTGGHRRESVPGPHHLLGHATGSLLTAIARQLAADLVPAPADRPRPPATAAPSPGGIR
ncbi:thioesterase domain-containing protein [Kitasatospora sp. NPDC096077]|uniref:thioesterase II family protein n=1 Tax=Kitasatospora sp. NPDC096077 TaxID=3155544 RepID=UPI0033225A7E